MGEHVQLFKMSKDRKNDFYSKKRFDLEPLICLCFVWVGYLMLQEVVLACHRATTRSCTSNRYLVFRPSLLVFSCFPDTGGGLRTGMPSDCAVNTTISLAAFCLFLTPVCVCDSELGHKFTGPPAERVQHKPTSTHTMYHTRSCAG